MASLAPEVLAACAELPETRASLLELRWRCPCGNGRRYRSIAWLDVRIAPPGNGRQFSPRHQACTTSDGRPTHTRRLSDGYQGGYGPSPRCARSCRADSHINSIRQRKWLISGAKPYACPHQPSRLPRLIRTTRSADIGAPATRYAQHLHAPKIASWRHPLATLGLAHVAIFLSALFYTVTCCLTSGCRMSLSCSLIRYFCVPMHPDQKYRGRIVATRSSGNISAVETLHELLSAQPAGSQLATMITAHKIYRRSLLRRFEPDQSTKKPLTVRLILDIPDSPV